MPVGDHRAVQLAINLSHYLFVTLVGISLAALNALLAIALVAMGRLSLIQDERFARGPKQRL